MNKRRVASTQKTAAAMRFSHLNAFWDFFKYKASWADSKAISENVTRAAVIKRKPSIINCRDMDEFSGFVN